jgi:hypothetical protein
MAGKVTIRGTDKSSITIEARLKGGALPDEMKIKYIQKKDYLVYYIETPCTLMDESYDFDPSNPNRIAKWKNNCNWNNDIEEFPIVEFTISVPRKLSVFASSLFNGDIDISDIDGPVWANHIDGNIKLSRIKQTSEVKTISGDIDIVFNNELLCDGEFTTISGDIRLEMSGEINALTSFKTFNGDMYTSAAEIEKIPRTIVTEMNDTGLKYMVEKINQLKLGHGGHQLKFETISGNVYLTSK